MIEIDTELFSALDAVQEAMADGLSVHDPAFETATLKYLDDYANARDVHTLRRLIRAIRIEFPNDRSL